MKKYCFDTCGISTPLEIMPADIHKSVWASVIGVLESGQVAVTKEVYDEMVHIPGVVGDCIRENEDQLVLEVEQGDWGWQAYIAHASAMQVTYEKVISELNGDRKKTVGLTDISAIALAKTLKLPLVSSEAEVQQVSETKKRIPEICDLEGVGHYTFNKFLRSEGISG